MRRRFYRWRRPRGYGRGSYGFKLHAAVRLGHLHAWAELDTAARCAPRADWGRASWGRYAGIAFGWFHATTQYASQPTAEKTT